MQNDEVDVTEKITKMNGQLTIRRYMYPFLG